MLYTISNGTYTAQVDSLGAQLVSLKGPDGWEYIWTGDPAYWTGHAPVLFPMVGGLRGGRAKIAGDWHQMGRHGFARHQEFALAEQGEGRLVLRSNPATLEAYPFPCALTVAYTLTENGYETAFTVENTGTSPCPTPSAATRGSTSPVDEQAAFEDYVIRFEKEETQRCPGIVGDKLLDYSQITLELEGEREIPLRHELFARDALIFENLNSHNRVFGEPRHRQGRGDGVLPVPPAGHLVRPEQRPLRLPGALDRLRHLGHRGGRLRAEEGHAHLGPQRQRELRLYHPLPVKGAHHGGLEGAAAPSLPKQGGPRLQRDRRVHGVLPALRRGGGRPTRPGPVKSPTWARSWPTWPSTCWAWRKSWMLTWARRCGGKWTSTAGDATAWWTASGSAWRTGPPGKTRKQRAAPHGLTCRGAAGKRSSSQGP